MRILPVFLFCVAVLWFRSIEITEYLITTEPLEQSVTRIGADGVTRSLTPVVDYPPDSYVGIWQCGWPLPWYTFRAKLIAHSDEGPFFAVHYLNSALLNPVGVLVNSIVILLTAFLASLAIHTGATTLALRLNIKMLLAITTIFAYQSYTTYARVAEDGQLTESQVLFIGETIASDTIRPLSTVIVCVAVAVFFHPKFVIKSVGVQKNVAELTPKNPTDRSGGPTAS